MLRQLFSRPPIKQFALGLAEDISRRYPPETESRPGKRTSVNRMTRIVEDASNKAKAFTMEHDLGWLGKARLGNAFKWALLEKGYKKEFADFATEAVIVTLSKKG